VNACRFSPDERFLLSAGDDRTIRLWDVESGALLQTEAMLMDPGRSVDFSTDGTRAISGHGALVKVGDNKWQPSSDNCLRFWSITLPNAFDLGRGR
jgi:WD40 repeat protein